VSWSGVISYGEWNYLFFVFDNVAKTVTLYKNGISLGLRSAPGALLPSDILYVGTYQNDSSIYTINATFDDVRIYNRALSAAEISAIYNATK
jgi:hypothetical protein